MQSQSSSLSFFFSPPYSITTGAPDGLSEQHNTAGIRWGEETEADNSIGKKFSNLSQS